MKTTVQPLVEGDIILPYRGNAPIMLFDNAVDQSGDTFIRARKHPGLNLWYSEVDEEAAGAAKPKDPHHWKSQGAVVFLTAQSIPINHGIRITRVFKQGLSARGQVIELPKGIVFPYQHDTEKLFQPLK
jgi:hypothetical protein